MVINCLVRDLPSYSIDLGSNYAKFENIYESCLDEILATYDELAAR